MKKELPFTIHVDPKKMANRSFHFADLATAELVYPRAISLVERDHGLADLQLQVGTDNSRIITISASEANLWVSSSQETPGADRQSFVVSELAKAALH